MEDKKYEMDEWSISKDKMDQWMIITIRWINGGQENIKLMKGGQLRKNG